jgi:hypothetical protein
VAWSTPTKITINPLFKAIENLFDRETEKIPHISGLSIYNHRGEALLLLEKEDPNNPNGDIFQVVWLNLIKVCRLKLTEDKKYKMDVIKKYLLHFVLTFYSIDLENIYICGLTQIKEFYVIC